MKANSLGKRLFLCEFLQESNSFNPVLADFEDFRSSGILEGEALLRSAEQSKSTIGGMFSEVQHRGGTAIGGVRMRSKSGGPVDHHVVDWFLDKTVSGLRAAMPLDGVLVSLHGATVSDVSWDVCGDILALVRETVGEDVVIAAACDLHANVTGKMMRNADFICGYQTYPHLDHYLVGQRAAALALDRLGGRPLRTVRVTIPMMAPAHGYTTQTGRLRELMERGKSLQDEGVIADYSIFQVQPWLDVAEMSSAVLITAENEHTAGSVAEELAHLEFSLRESLQGEPLWMVPEVIQAAIANQTDKPVVMVDSADSPNAGASGDSAAVLEQLLPYRSHLRVALAVNDEAAVEKALSLGVGGRGDFLLGGSLAPQLTKPVLLKDAEVKSLHTGDFILGGPAERGEYRSVGRAAVLKADELYVLVTVRGQNAGDVQFYRGFGIEPTLCRLVCIKACTSFRAGYEPISALICNAQTPGAACPVLTDLPYQHLPVPFYPFQEIGGDAISEPVCYR